MMLKFEVIHTFRLYNLKKKIGNKKTKDRGVYIKLLLRFKSNFLTLFL
jgi:hypothetical protein